MPDVSPQDVLAGSYEAYSRALDADFAETVKERETYRAALTEELRTEAERLRQHGYTVSVEVHFGDPAQRIVDFVNDEGIDLVAMATHGRTGIGRLLMGSVVERDALVLERGSAPEAMLQMAQEGDYDLVVVGSQSGPGYFLGSVANSVVMYAPQSVLVVRTRAH